MTRRPEPGTYVYVAVAVAIAIGVTLAAAGAWRFGVTVAGVAMVAGGVFRGAVPERSVGLLRVRRRSTDVVLMIGMGAVLIALAAMVPPPPPA